MSSAPLVDTSAARQELRELADAYALGVDRRDPRGVAELFAREGSLVSTFGPGTPEKPLVRSGREDIATALTLGLARYVRTTHLVGAHEARVSGDSANCETSCLAHHVYERDGTRRLLVIAVRYEDSCVYEDGKWRFDERKLWAEWQTDVALDT